MTEDPVPLVLDLDDERSLDPAVSGAKAAWLARGRAASLPVLPGLVVTASASRPAMELAIRTMVERGSGGARLVVARMDLEPRLTDDLDRMLPGLGEELVVRSSSVLEEGREWAGAFTSYVDVGPDDVTLSVRGCWASAFSVHALERHEAAGVAPGSAPMGVLVQPLFLASWGGTARLDGDDVAVVAVAGSPAAVVQGWEPGAPGRVSVDGTATGKAVELLGREALGRVAAELRMACDDIGATSCEWAIDSDGGFVFLQLGRVRQRPTGQQETPVIADGRAARIAALTWRFPGTLGEELVLPWALSMHALPSEATHGGVAPTIDDLIEWSGRLAETAWDTDRSEALDAARDTIRMLRGTDVEEALDRTDDLTPIAQEEAAALLGALRLIREELVEAGAVPDPDLAWHLGVDEARRILAGQLVPRPRARFGYSVWEPFDTAVVLGTGAGAAGVPASRGVGCGRLRFVRDGESMARFLPRDVVVALRPLPSWAQLLWDAAAVVTVGGGPGAHLFESARALAIPAVCGVQLEETLGMSLQDADGRFSVAVDGTNGIVAVAEW